MEKLKEKITNFRDERGWKPYHKPKDLAISISLEANEMLENFHWKSDEQAVTENLENIKDEMADVFIYLIQLSEVIDVDLVEIAEKKIKKNAEKSPISK